MKTILSPRIRSHSGSPDPVPNDSASWSGGYICFSTLKNRVFNKWKSIEAMADSNEKRRKDESPSLSTLEGWTAQALIFGRHPNHYHPKPRDTSSTLAAYLSCASTFAKDDADHWFQDQTDSRRPRKATSQLSALEGAAGSPPLTYSAPGASKVCCGTGG